MQDTAEAIARDLVAEVGRANALLHLWREAVQVWRLMLAVLRA